MTMMERIEKMRVSDDALDLVFRKARTYNAWLPRPVPDDLLRQLYDTLKWGPTSANISPARFVFIRSKAAKERLRPSLAPGNVEKTMAAPVTVIIAYDLKFYDKLPRLFPHSPAMRDMFVNNPQVIQETALRNSTLQGAHMILRRGLWDSTVGRCQALITQNSMRSSSRPANVSPVSRSFFLKGM